MSSRVPVAFARVLRSVGVDVPVGSVVAYAQALEATGVERRAQVYWAGRATLVVRPEDVPAYDAAFAAFWLASPAISTAPPAVEIADVVVATGRYSPHEVLRHKDFAAYTDDEAAEARRLLSQFRLRTPPKPSRRAAPTRRGTPDVRRIVRHALRTHGEPFRRPAKGPTTAPRRLVLLLDVSASMELYARALVRFVHAAVSGRTSTTRVDAFAIGTRVTRLTRELQSRDPDAAIAAAVRRAPDWSGGTRLGDGLHELNSRWPAHGAVVVILSDGWDRGDPDRLAEQLARTQRAAHRVVWVNPLKASPGYEPLARGMAAALPYVDDFVEGHSLAALQHLARLIAR